MSDPITMERAELDQYIRNTADQAIQTLINELGLKRRPLNPWVSKNFAVKKMHVGIGRLEKAILRGVIRTKVDMEKRTHCIFVLKADVQKLINNPTL